MPEFMIAIIGACVASALLTKTVRVFALKKGMLDVPNARSSHQMPTPRGGGLAIAVVTSIGLVVLVSRGLLHFDAFLGLLAGGVAIAVVGFVDDRIQLPVKVRLGVHFAAALWVLVCLGGLPAIQFSTVTLSLGEVGMLLGALGIVWTVNLFNFMDGIDGIAASEALFVSWSGALLTYLSGGDPGVWVSAAWFGAACCGFLIWNWPPARIFMGDVGSGYIGFIIAALAVVSARADPGALIVWLILSGTFFTDATVTLVRRALRREKLHEAHRSHAYQRLALRWQSHWRVTILVAIVNFAWLLPCAFLAAARPSLAGWIAIGALAPLVVAVSLIGWGESEAERGNHQG